MVKLLKESMLPLREHITLRLLLPGVTGVPVIPMHWLFPLHRDLQLRRLLPEDPLHFAAVAV
ncbi:hypothetical protein D3C86_1058750 [compost metagenome]